MFKSALIISALALVALVAVVSCSHSGEEHLYGDYTNAGYAAYPHASNHHHRSSRLKQKLRNIKYDPKVQQGIHAIKPAVGMAASVAQPILDSAFRKANDWSNRRGSFRHGGHFAAGYQGGYHSGGFGSHQSSHLPYSSGAHHSEFREHETSVHY